MACECVNGDLFLRLTAIWLVYRLYDNPQIAGLYLDAFQTTGKQQYSLVARGVLDYLLRDMRHQEGGFYSAEVPPPLSTPLALFRKILALLCSHKVQILCLQFRMWRDAFPSSIVREGILAATYRVPNCLLSEERRLV